MSSIHHLVKHIRQYGDNHRSLYLLSAMLLFWSIFDGIVSYIAPLIITERGISESMMGIIIGSSSIAGAAFDLLACRFMNNFNYRRVFMMMFAICFVYPLILWGAKTIWMFLIAMAIWGVYYDFHNFGLFNFIGTQVSKKEHASSFGVAHVFYQIGYIIAPLIAGMVAVEYVQTEAYAISWIFLFIAFLVFLVLLRAVTDNKKTTENNCSLRPRKKRFVVELSLINKIGKAILPVLILTTFLYIIDSFFWTIGPIYSEGMGLEEFGGVFLMAYSIPPLLMGWFIGNITRKHGKKKSAYVSLLIGSCILSVFFLISNPIQAVVLAFLVAVFTGIAFPAIEGAYADYISETPEAEEEIEAVEDFFNNIGYILGPIMAGFLAQYLGILNSFSILGVVGIVVSVILIIVTPKSITVRKAL